MIERLGEFLTFEKDWNSYGADPITPEAVTSALRVIALVTQEYGGKHKDRCFPYFVCPTPRGGVQLEWASAAYYLEVEIQEDGTLGGALWENYAKPQDDPEKYIEWQTMTHTQLIPLVGDLLNQTPQNGHFLRAMFAPYSGTIFPSKDAYERRIREIAAQKIALLPPAYIAENLLADLEARGWVRQDGERYLLLIVE